MAKADAEKNNKPTKSEPVAEQTVETPKEEVYEELNLEQKVTVKSIAPWATGFTRIVEGIGDVQIVPNGSVRLTRGEIIAQSQSGNVGFNGFDGKGSHATYYIEDAPTRKELGFESLDGTVKQEVFSDDLIKKLFKIDDQGSFEDSFKRAIVTRAEKHASLQSIKKLKLNDYSKIRFVENYTGVKL